MLVRIWIFLSREKLKITYQSLKATKNDFDTMNAFFANHFSIMAVLQVALRHNHNLKKVLSKVLLVSLLLFCSLYG